MRVPSWIVAVALATGIAGCGNSAEPPTGPVSVPVWQEPADYRFEATSGCGERWFIGRYRIVVADHEVVEATLENDDIWEPVDGLDHVMTMGEMLAEGRSKEKTADRAVLRFDPVDGHPTLIDIDPRKNAIDEESCYEILDYRVEKSG
jgi:hypothetical protein